MSDQECMPADPCMVFLHRAHARLILVEAGQMTPQEAIGGLIEPFREVAHGAFCRCDCETMARLGKTNSKLISSLRKSGTVAA